MAVVIKATGKVIEQDKPPVMRRIWDNYVVIGEVQKSDFIKYVVAAAVRDGVRYVNVREFYYGKKSGLWKPGKDGITIPLVIPIEQGLSRLTPYVNLIELLANAKVQAEIIELSNEANSVSYIVKKRTVIKYED